MLEEERAYYDENLQEWLRLYPSRFVLVKGRTLIGSYDTNDALREGARLFGRESFLVRRVEANPPMVSIPALSMGILRADSTRTTFRAGTDT